MDAQSSGLIVELYANKVIDKRDRDAIEAVTSSTERNEKLLSHLGRKSKEKFNLFLKAMTKLNQKYIVSELCGSEESLDMPGN
jgi:hypothetical protein